MHGINRPRNRQQRPPRQQHQRPAQNITVPTVEHVKPGASVSIVLKTDQRSGRETPGIVQDLLTRGNHPRGIKVRLRDGQVGRVQQMGGTESNFNANCRSSSSQTSATTFPKQQAGPEERYLSELPPRDLSAFIPELAHEPIADVQALGDAAFFNANIKCPICGLFEGDEAAVSHHVESHIT